MKKILIVLGGLLVLLVAGVLVGPSLIDWNRYKGDIQAQARKALGRELTITGDIKITVLPAPALIAADVALANIEGASAPTMATLKLLEVRIAMAPLLAGRVEVEQITLVDPVIQLEALADGRRNWVFDGGAADNGAARAGAEGAGRPARAVGPGAQVALDNFTIQNGTLIYKDAKSGTIERIDAVNANIAAASLNGPFESEGKLALRGVPLEYGVNIGEIIHSRTVPFNLKLGIGASGTKLQMNGTAVGLADKPQVKGRLRGEGTALADLVQVAAPAAAMPGPFGQAFEFDGTLSADAGIAELKGLVIKLGDTQASGDVTIDYAATPVIAARVAANRIDLDKWLALPDVAAKAVALNKGPGSGAGAAGAATGSKAAAEAAPVAIPRNVNGSLIFSAEAITYRDGIIRDAILNAELAGGEVRINQFSAQLPGGSDVSLSGRAAMADGGPRFEGQTEATVNDLRGVMRWLGVDAAGVPAERLRKLTIVSRVAATSSQAQLTNIDMTLDSSRVTGGVTVALTQRPSFGADVSVDRLNLGAYLPPAATTEKPSAAAKKSDDGAAPSGKQATDARPSDPLAGLAVLNDFDANLRARVKSLNFDGVAIKDAVFDGTLYNGALDIRRLGVAEAAGASVSATGKLAGFGGTLEAKALTFKVSAADVPRLMDLGGVKSTLSAKKIGTVALSGRIDGNLMAPAVDVQVNGAGATIRIKGRIDRQTMVPSVKALSVRIDALDVPRLLAAAGMDVPPAAKALGKVSVAGNVDGNLLTPSLSLAVKAAGGELTLNGPLNTTGAGSLIDFAVVASHPEFSKVLTALGGYRPAGRLGQLDLKARLKGDAGALTITALDGKIGDTTLKGDVVAELNGRRPDIKANLVTGPLVLDAYLPAEKSASLAPDIEPPNIEPKIIPASWPVLPKTAPRSPATGLRLVAIGRWSTEPIDLTALGALDGALVLKSPSIQFEQYRLDNADIAATLKDGRLDAERVAGTIFGGALQATLGATATARPKVSTVFALENMNIEGATRALTGSPVATGRMSMKGNLASSGRNVAELIAALGGDGAFRMRGVDVSGANTGTAMAGALGLVSAFNQLAGGLGGRAGGGAEIGGAFLIKNGVATSRNMQVVSGAGEGVAAGSVDLPRWRIDVTGNVKLAPNVLTALLSRGTRTDVTQAVPFTVRGRLDAPTINIDTSKLPGGALPIPGVDKLLKKAPKGVGTILEGILGGAQPGQGGAEPQPQPQQQPQQQQQQQQQIRPEDILKQIFRR